MEVSGRPHEGLITLIPVAVLVLFVVGVMGGPAAFINTLALWGGDLVNFVVSWLKSL